MLVIGKRKPHKNEAKVGGAIVLFEQLLTDLHQFGIDYEVIDLNYINYKNKVIAYVNIAFDIIRKGIRHKQLFLNGSNNVLWLYGLPIFVLKVISQKSVIVRFFGGNFDEYFNTKVRIVRWLLKWFLKRANVVFFEQRYQVEQFVDINPNTYWFPNVRSFPFLESLRSETLKQFENRFVFISHIRKEKGVDEILKVKKMLGNKIHIELYGPVLNYTCPAGYEGIFKDVYKGALRSEEVVSVLSRHNVLLLPTFWEGEGYPGIIIEALAVGLPVIATKMRGIEEMFSNEAAEAAVFIESRNADSLKEAVSYFCAENFERHQRAALLAFEQFDSSKQMPNIIKRINNC
jgi:glycosyltransferase involved in cell wall biosynthesis